MKMDLVQFGKRLAAARRAAGLTQPALAQKVKRAGMEASFQYIGHLENATPHDSSGKPRRPPFELVKFLANELKQSEREWLDLAGYSLSGEDATSLAPRPVDAGVVFQGSFYKNLTDEQLEKVNRMANRERERRLNSPRRKKKPPKGD